MLQYMKVTALIASRYWKKKCLACDRFTSPYVHMARGSASSPSVHYGRTGKFSESETAVLFHNVFAR